MAAFNFDLLDQLVRKVGGIAGDFGRENLKPVGSGRMAQQALGKQADLKYNLLALLLRNAGQGQAQSRSVEPGSGGTSISGSPNFGGGLGMNWGEKGTVEGMPGSGPGQYVAGITPGQISDPNIRQQIGAMYGNGIKNVNTPYSPAPNTAGASGGIAPGTIQQLGNPQAQTSGVPETYASYFKEQNITDPTWMKLLMSLMGQGEVKM